MKSIYPSLSLVLTKSPKKHEVIPLGAIAFYPASRRFTRTFLRFALMKARGNRKLAAEIAGVSPGMVFYNVRRFPELAREFPSSKATRKYEFTFKLSEAAFLPFDGTLVDLEDRYIVQVLIHAKGDRKKANKILGSNPYAGRVMTRVRRRPDIAYLRRIVEQEPLPFDGALTELRIHYVKQVLVKCGYDKVAAMRILGIAERGTFKTLLARAGLGRAADKISQSADQK